MSNSNKTKHTSGPWKCSPLDRNNRFVVFQPNEHPAGAVRPTDEVLANARLIAAAPDILCVLIEAVDHAHVYNTPQELIKLFQAVIKKATGGAK